MLALAAATSLVAVNAGAQMNADNDQHHFIVLDSSTVDDVRAIGGQSIGNLGDYQGFGGALDITDPANWGIADADMSTLPSVAVDPNSANIDGTLEISDGSVSAATLNLLGELSFGLFQSTPGWAGATTERLANLVTSGLVWTYDAGTDPNVMLHGAEATSTCVNAGADGGTGSCSIYRSPTVSATNGNSIWRWDGLPDGWTASNSRGTMAFPWGEDTCSPAAAEPGPNSVNCPAGHIVVAQDGGTPGISWDLSGLGDCETQDTCSITARAVASGMGAAAEGGNNTGVSALYTLNLQVDKSPRAADDTAVVQAGMPEALDVLANDYIYDRDNFDLSLDTDGTRGTAIVLGGNTVHYTPPEDASGTDSFSYTIDSEGAQSTATVTITLNNQPADEDGEIEISTLGIAPDSTSGSFTIPTANLGDLPASITFAGATKGTVTVDGATLTYTPNADFYSGDDSFTYTITDNDGEIAGGTITVTIENVAPVVTVEAATTRVGKEVNQLLDIIAGNGPLEDHPREVNPIGENGECSLNDDRTVVTFSPEAGFRGEGSCTVTVTDLDGSTASASFAVTVRAAPVESSGGSSSLDLWLLSMLGAGIWLRRRRPA